MNFSQQFTIAIQTGILDPDVMQRELCQKLFDNAPDPIVIVNDRGAITLVNLEAERRFGYRAEDLMDQPLEVLMPERFRKGHVAYREAFSNSNKKRFMGNGLELVARHSDGTEFPVEISLSPLQIGPRMLVMSIIRDITDRKNAERTLKEKTEELALSNLELNRSNRELEQFAYIASHDLQEPLRSIAGSCQMIEKSLPATSDPMAREFITYAIEGTKRMEALISDLLAYSRVTSKPKERIPIDCQLIVDHVLTNLSYSITDTQAKIEIGPLPFVFGNRSQVIQVFQNLIANALKFRSSMAPLVSITAENDGQFVSISIKDNGIGIEKKYFDRIFQIFKKLHLRDKYKGTGIGLATCKKIVEQHGGRIWVSSEPGQGSSFTFTLPNLTEKETL